MRVPDEVLKRGMRRNASVVVNATCVPNSGAAMERQLSKLWILNAIVTVVKGILAVVSLAT